MKIIKSFLALGLCCAVLSGPLTSTAYEPKAAKEAPKVIPKVDRKPLLPPKTFEENLSSFAKEGTMLSFNYNRTNYKQKLGRAKDFFQPMAWQTFINSSFKIKELDLVKSGAIIVKSEVIKPAKVQKVSEAKTQSWIISFPLRVFYISEIKEQKKQWLVEITAKLATVNNELFITEYSFKASESKTS